MANKPTAYSSFQKSNCLGEVGPILDFYATIVSCGVVVQDDLIFYWTAPSFFCSN
jgi:hypothetical protein